MKLPQFLLQISAWSPSFFYWQSKNVLPLVYYIEDKTTPSLTIVFFQRPRHHPRICYMILCFGPYFVQKMMKHMQTFPLLFRSRGDWKIQAWLMQLCTCKVQLFWEGLKNVRNRPNGFEIYMVNVKTMRTITQIFSGLLRKAYEMSCFSFFFLETKSWIHNF